MAQGGQIRLFLRLGDVVRGEAWLEGRLIEWNVGSPRRFILPLADDWGRPNILHGSPYMIFRSCSGEIICTRKCPDIPVSTAAYGGTDSHLDEDPTTVFFDSIVRRFPSQRRRVAGTA